MKRKDRTVMPLFTLLALLVSAFAVEAQMTEAGNGGPGPVNAPHLTVELVSASSSVSPGGSTDLGLVFSLEKGWHVYWINAGDSGEAPHVRWTLPDGVAAGSMRFPVPSRLPLGPVMDYGYEGKVAFPIPLNVGATVKPEPRHLDAQVGWLVCREVCIPGKAHLGIDLNIARNSVPGRSSGPLADSLAALPKQLSPGMKVSVVGGAKELVLTLTGVPRGPAAEVYPFDGDQIANAGEQQVETVSDGVRVRMPRAAELTKLPNTFHAVVKVSTGKGYEVNAVMVPGEVAASPNAVGGAADLTVVGAIGLALLGGVILNLMPCVFPVLFLKGLSLVQSSGEERKRLRSHGLLYTLGILVSFWIIVAVLLALRAGGRQAGWGFELQSPNFVVVLAAGLFFFALSLAGQFDLGLSLTSAGGSLAKKEGLTGSFFTGVLATVVATPCTAPLMGAAIGFALSQTPVVTFAIFTALGLGLAGPYLLLTLQPAWARWLPRPGAWMETLRQLTAVPLFGTVIWLVWVYGRLFSSDTAQGADHIVRLLWCLLVVAIAGWTLAKWPAKRGSAFGAALLVLAGIAIPLTVAKREDLKWEPYSQAALEQARVAGRPVFIDFTAAWCLSCQVNERLVLRATDVERQLAYKNFVLMRADWTQYDPAITAQLASVGRNGVPTYVLYPGGQGQKPDVLPELLTKTVVLNAIHRDAR